MSRRDNAELRCVRCRLHVTLCFCALVPSITVATRVALVIHRRESSKTTNTGLLATRCLSNSQVLVRGGPGESSPIAQTEGTQLLLLFPHKDALPIAQYAQAERKITLVVPDGTWGQAARVQKRVEELRGVPCVTVPDDAPTRYGLRRETHHGGMATLEAIARALGVLEGMHVRRALEQVLRVMVERTLWSRGALADGEVTTGLPAGAFRG